jgi:prefoldin subunit 5
MHNKTVSKILVAIIMTSMLIAIIPTMPVGAVTLAGINPTSGNVGTKVTVIGTIDTLGGAYTIYFDTDDNGNAFDAGEDIKTGNAPANSYNVSTSFTVPACLGSDAGNAHLVVLRDNQTLASQSTTFQVITSRKLSVASSHDQEGDTQAITMTVTGGTVANQANNYTVGVYDPTGTWHTMANFSFVTDGVGSGSVTRNYPTTFTPTAPGTNMTGTYTVVANRTAPGAITNASVISFTVGLTDKLAYGRFDTISVKTSGWVPNQNVTITIYNTTGGVAKQWANQNLTTGEFTNTWVIPWNAPMGTWNITATNVTGSDKTIKSTHTFTVGSAALTVAYTVQPTTPQVRTNTVRANFTIKYPDTTLYNTTQFSSISVSVYANKTLVTTIALTTANYNSPTGTWQVAWKIPRNASLGSGYKFTVSKNAIVDINANEGPSAAAGASSTAFTVNAATLTVKVTQQPAANYTRVQTAMAKINVTYPDNTFFTDADLGSMQVRVYMGATNVANVTLVAADYNSTSKDWTVSWASGYNATLVNYMFTAKTNEIMDASANKGPASDVSTNAFELLKARLTVTSVNTNKASYARGEFVSITFTATYPDGTPVTTGTSTVVLMAPDGFTTVNLNPVPLGTGVFSVTWWASDAQQTGSWNVTLNVNAVADGATANATANTGPTAAVKTSFTVLPAAVTLEDIIAAIQDLDARLDAVEADTTSLGTSLSSVSTAVTSLRSVVDDLQDQLDSLSATAATDADVAAVSSAVDDLSADLAALEASLADLSDTAATDADVAAVSSAVDALSEDIASLESSLNALSTAVDAAATTADVDAAVSDLSGDIGGINTLVIVAVVLALIAAVAAIAAVYIIQRKIAG